MKLSWLGLAGEGQMHPKREITKDDALRLVQESLDRPPKPKGYPNVLVMPEHAIEKSTYFVIRYQSEEYIMSGDFLRGLVGNAP